MHRKIGVDDDIEARIHGGLSYLCMRFDGWFSLDFPFQRSKVLHVLCACKVVTRSRGKNDHFTRRHSTACVSVVSLRFCLAVSSGSALFLSVFFLHPVCVLASRASLPLGLLRAGDPIPSLCRPFAFSFFPPRRNQRQTPGALRSHTPGRFRFRCHRAVSLSAVFTLLIYRDMYVDAA